MSPPRILHAPFDVGGQAYGLSRAERELGLESDVVVFGPQRWGYDNDIDLHAALPVPVHLRMARRARFLAHALPRYDIFHFNFGHTLLQVRQLGRVVDELPLLRRLGKTVLVTYQGCDARTFPHCWCRKPECIGAAPYRQAAAARFLRYADRAFYLNPDLGKLLPGARFLPYASVDPLAVEPAPARAPGDEIVIAHAPTNRVLKGTEHVIGAVDLLRSQGHSVRLDLHENLTRGEVLERLTRADLVVDQLRIGWYGGLAVEAMALGKPVVCHIDANDNPFGDRLPIVRATPASLADVLRELISNPERLGDIGRACRAFVEREHDPRAVAREVLAGLAPLPGS